jgi:hypothetical protein
MTGTVSYTLDGSPVEGCQDLAVEYTNYESLVGCNITFTSTGEYTISANYSGSTSFGPSSTTSVEDVLLLATTTLTQSPATIVVGQAPTFIATVSGDGPTPTGSVSIIYGDQDLCNGQLTNGRMQCTDTQYPFLATGSGPDYTVYAGYNGDSSYANSVQSNTYGTSTMDIVPAATQTVLTDTTSNANDGITVTYTAKVSAVAPGSGTPQYGTVSFTINGQPINGCSANPIGYAGAGLGESICFGGLAQLGQPVVATYEEDPDYTGSSSAPVVASYTPIPTTTYAAVAEQNPATAGEVVTYHVGRVSRQRFASADW